VEGKVSLYKCVNGAVSAEEPSKSLKLKWSITSEYNITLVEEQQNFINPSFFMVPAMTAIGGEYHELLFTAWFEEEE
jgi:hypothetical protein